MTSEVVVDHGATFCGLLLVPLEHGDQTKECKDGTVDKNSTRRGDRGLCLECPEGQMILSKVTVGRYMGCYDLLLKVVAHDDR